MNDIVIRRCTVRVTRHGGWSWGPDRRGLVDRMTRLLPQLIAARLSELLGDAEGEVETPLRVRARLELGGALAEGALREAVEAALTAEALAGLVRHTTARHPTSSSQQGSADEAQVQERAGSSGSLPPDGAVRALLLGWRAQGDLIARLHAFSEATLRVWLIAFVEQAAKARSGPAGLEDGLLDEARAIRDRLVASGKIERRAEDRLRLIIAIELAARHGSLPPAPYVWRWLDDLLPHSGSPATVSGDAPLAREAVEGRMSGETSTDAMISLPATKEAGAQVRRPAPDRDIRLVSVLPFLVLGMLRRMGWLDVAAATIEALATPDHGSIFATVLVSKLLPRPRHSRYRDDAALRTAAAFAGRAAPPSQQEFRSFCRLAEGKLSALDAFVATELANGHSPGQPLHIARIDNQCGPGWLLLDGDGLFPAAWCREGEEAAVLVVLAGFSRSVVVVAEAAATRPLMESLVTAGRPFVTRARPSRGEGWRPLIGASSMWASGGSAAPDHLLAAAGRSDSLDEAAQRINDELIVRRPLSAGGDVMDVERAVVLGAAAGLGLIAWTLWREREAVDPLLALERFGDLDGTARLTETGIDVRPAVGRRYLDLREHGLLADIGGVPWLAGGTIRFIGP